MEGAPDDDYDVDIDLDAGFKVGRHDVESIRRPEPGRLPRGGGMRSVSARSAPAVDRANHEHVTGTGK